MAAGLATLTGPSPGRPPCSIDTIHGPVPTSLALIGYVFCLCGTTVIACTSFSTTVFVWATLQRSFGRRVPFPKHFDLIVRARAPTLPLPGRQADGSPAQSTPSSSSSPGSCTSQVRSLLHPLAFGPALTPGPGRTASTSRRHDLHVRLVPRAQGRAPPGAARWVQPRTAVRRPRSSCRLFVGEPPLTSPSLPCSTHISHFIVAGVIVGSLVLDSESPPLRLSSRRLPRLTARYSLSSRARSLGHHPRRQEPPDRAPDEHHRRVRKLAAQLPVHHARPAFWPRKPGRPGVRPRPRLCTLRTLAVADEGPPCLARPASQHRRHVLLVARRARTGNLPGLLRLRVRLSPSPLPRLPRPNEG